MTVALLVAAALAVACVVLLALPFLRETAEARTVSSGARRRLDALEERDRALAALKELEFDHRTGKIEGDDYRALVIPLRRRVGEALHALDSVPRDAAHEREENDVSTPSAVDPTPSQPPEPARIPEPMPPPDEGQPPEPARIPEPFPPPDEGDRPEQPSIPEPTPGGAAAPKQ